MADEKDYKCMNRMCIEYQIPVSIKKPNPWTENEMDCHNCNGTLKKLSKK